MTYEHTDKHGYRWHAFVDIRKRRSLYRLYPAPRTDVIGSWADRDPDWTFSDPDLVGVRPDWDAAGRYGGPVPFVAVPLETTVTVTVTYTHTASTSHEIIGEELVRRVRGLGDHPRGGPGKIYSDCTITGVKVK